MIMWKQPEYNDKVFIYLFDWLTDWMIDWLVDWLTSLKRVALSVIHFPALLSQTDLYNTEIQMHRDLKIANKLH